MSRAFVVASNVSGAIAMATLSTTSCDAWPLEDCAGDLDLDFRLGGGGDLGLEVADLGLEVARLLNLIRLWRPMQSCNDAI